MTGHLIELYGMLETGFHTYTRFTDDPQKVNGTIGRVVGEMELRIIDDAGNDVPYGEIGEIRARGPSVHLGYHNNPSANAAVFIKGGWFRTGDLGRYVDPQGNVQITGRSKEIINRGGKKFFPREVEEILYTHPKILHAAMVGIPDRRLGERNCLCVVPKPQQTLSLDEAVSLPEGTGRRLQAAGDDRAVRRSADDRHRQDQAPHPARPRDRAHGSGRRAGVSRTRATSAVFCHARPCAGHPAWEGTASSSGMAGTSPAMTRRKA